VQAFEVESIFLNARRFPLPVAAGRLMTTAPAVASQIIVLSVDSTVYGEEAKLIAVSFQCACLTVAATDPEPLAATSPVRAVIPLPHPVQVPETVRLLGIKTLAAAVICKPSWKVLSVVPVEPTFGTPRCKGLLAPAPLDSPDEI
jgi:hypothetical protein